MRLAGKVAIVVGAGQTAGDTIGNGRATAMLFAREGARVLAVDRNLDSAEETAALIAKEGGACTAVAADATLEADCEAFVATALSCYGRIDVLHNNVGIGTGDGGLSRLTEETWDRVFDVNVKTAFFACKKVVPVMREQLSGSIINVSSIASICSAGILAYKSSKAALNAFTHGLSMLHAKHGIRVNAILPGLMNTPMAIESISRARQMDKGELVKARDAMVPLGGKMGTAWDVAYAALFLASDEAKFVTGVLLPVDGGQSARIG
ncbi:MAG TPA: SDR family NAD(P)-dependent oxidoreductase [Polyangiaceae bacterium]|nr:SDR family NAD(P)-dependent oxidoreductase [Polyangiaceae bacterium]